MAYYLIYAITLVFAAVYSFVLIDPNITFFNNGIWTAFRNAAVQVGYYQRPLSTGMFISIVIALFALHWWGVKNAKRINPVKLACLIGGILLFSYPLLSHDFFNYMFDAKILTYYHQNPYFHAALDYPDDTWLRFMQWVHRPYPYGPVFLALTVVPAFLGLGKFIVHFYLLKLLVVSCYIASVYYLNKLNKDHAVWLATQPLLLIEGVLVGHNEIFALCLGIMALYFMANRKGVIAFLLLGLSAGIKFMSFPFLFIERWKYRWLNYISLLLMIGVLYYATFKVLIQPWYFINLLFFLPVFPVLIRRLELFYFGLVVCYYPYVLLGEWTQQYNVTLKNWIISAFFIANVVYLLVVVVKDKKVRNSLLSETWCVGERT